MPIILSIQIGRNVTYTQEGPSDGKARTWTTAFNKSPLNGSATITDWGVAGDEQVDRENHGGLDKAILAYSADHYAYWREHLNLPDMPHGAFGENLTIAGLEESTVCIGDQWQAGAVLFEVSQPRQPCWKMGRRWQIVDLPKQVINNGRGGWYLRVLTPGELASNSEIALVSRPRPSWTIARANRLFYHEPDNVADLQDLANIPELSRAWREDLLQKIARRSI
jgi:MOSC domain-containing protein YiiM